MPNRSSSSSEWNYTPELPLKPAPFLRWPVSPLEVGRHLARTWSPLTPRVLMLGVAVVVWLWLTPDLQRTASLEFGWIGLVGLRNFLIVLVTCGGMHWLLYRRKRGSEFRYDSRPLGVKKRVFLFNGQVADNATMTLIPAVLVWTVWEALALWCYGNGIAAFGVGSDWANVWYWVWFWVFIALIPIWSAVAFSLGHRLLHTRWGYKRVHYWHHRNVNIGPWSGLAMHPAEHVLLFADIVILFVLPSHPVHLYFMMLHHGMGAPLSHTGYDRLVLWKQVAFKMGDFHHQLHHRFIECNYGGAESPLDSFSDAWHDGTPEGDERIAARRKRLRTRG